MHFLNSSVLVPLDNLDLSVSIATITSLKKNFSVGTFGLKGTANLQEAVWLIQIVTSTSLWLNVHFHPMCCVSAQFLVLMIKTHNPPPKNCENSNKTHMIGYKALQQNAIICHLSESEFRTVS